MSIQFSSNLPNLQTSSTKALRKVMPAQVSFQGAEAAAKVAEAATGTNYKALFDKLKTLVDWPGAKEGIKNIIKAVKEFISKIGPTLQPINEAISKNLGKLINFLKPAAKVV